VLVLNDLNHISGEDLPDLKVAGAEKLRAQAARYRLLAETLFDPSVVAVVQECAGELEAEAKALEKTKSDDDGAVR
jgi:hypothetical protein